MEKHIGDHVAPPIAFVPFKQVPEGEVKRRILDASGEIPHKEKFFRKIAENMLGMKLPRTGITSCERSLTTPAHRSWAGNHCLQHIGNPTEILEDIPAQILI